MKTLKITQADLDKDNFYIGKEELSDYFKPFDGNIEIDGGLGYVKFKKSIVLSGDLIAKAGSGITAGSDITAGEGITAGWGIKASSGITAGWGIEAGEGITAGWGIKAGGSITAGKGIKAGDGITAGRGIEAGSDIEAGWDIEAGEGITAGEDIKAGSGIVSLHSSVKAKLNIVFNSSCTLSAGIFSTSGEKEIEAQEILGGKVIYGKVNIIESSLRKMAL